jgi:hypothetical protein
MLSLDLYALRETFNKQRIMLCFNGPISHSLIEELGRAVRNYLEAEQAQPGAAMDVFAVYIEMTQNIRQYAALHNYGDLDAAGTVVVGRDDLGRYIVSAGNVVEMADGRALMARLEELAPLDKAALKAAYKEQLRRPRSEAAGSGAGLGLIDIARKASAPLSGTLATQGERGYFSLTAII